MTTIWMKDDGDDAQEPITSSKPFPVVVPALQFNRMGSHLVGSSALRDLGRQHRSLVTAVDTLAVPGTLTVTDDGATAGSTLANVAFTCAVSAGNQWGPTGPGTIPGTVTPVLNHSIRFAFAQVAGSTYYDLFIGAAAAPLWVGRITEAQRAAGGFIINAVGTVTAGGNAVAGSVDVGIAGTGVAPTVNPFVSNNAYTPASVTPVINCAGFARAHVQALLTVTDLRSLPTCTLVPYFQSQGLTGNWYGGAAMTMAPLTAVGTPLLQDFVMTVDGATAMVILVSIISGQGAAVSVWVELA